MLASVLPGFRQLRAPFAAGALILAAIYVAIYDRLQPAATSDYLKPGLDSLLRLLGPQGRTVVLGVTAYLVGTVLVAAVRGVIRSASIRRIPQLTSAEYLTAARKGWSGVVAPFSRPSLRRIIRLCQDEFADPGLAKDVCSEIIAGGGKRLLVSNKDLYIEWDRTQSEAEFRDAIIAPVAIFAIVALAAVHWAWWVKAISATTLAVITAVLWIDARRLDREANSMYAHAVADGTVATASIEARRDSADHRPRGQPPS